MNSMNVDQDLDNQVIRK